MTKDDVIRLARQAGWTGIYSQWVSPTEREHLTVPVTMEQIKAFAKLVAEHERKEFAIHAVDIARRAVMEEREACARLFDARDNGIGFYEPHEPAEMIRARGKP